MDFQRPLLVFVNILASQSKEKKCILYGSTYTYIRVCELMHVSTLVSYCSFVCVNIMHIVQRFFDRFKKIQNSISILLESLPL